MHDSLVEALCRDLSDEAIDPGVAAARSGLLAFQERMRPDYEAAWFHVRVASELDAFAEGRVVRLILCMPPQHGKTELASRALPAYLLGREPDLRIIASSYADDLASRTNLDVQRLIDSESYAELFPATRLAGPRLGRRMDVDAVRSRRTQHLFEIVGRRGSYRSAGVGVGITGMPADVGIIDDPIKDRGDAESATVREAVWQWYTGSFRPRARGRILIIMTRWHEDDLVGRLTALAGRDPAADQWTVVRIPAIAEGAAGDPRQPGEALWPARFPAAEMAALRTTLGSYQFEGMYQQRPTSPGGMVFKLAWFQVVDARPAIVGGTQRCRYWDCAGTEGAGDWTVGALITRTPDGLWWVEDVIRGQWGPSDVDRIIRQTAAVDGPYVMIREEREPGSSGKAVIEARARSLAGFDYKGDPVDENKLLRWRPFAAQAEAGNVRVVRAAWTADFLAELAAAPGGLHDDQCDSASGGFLALARRPAPAQVAVKLSGF